MSHLTSSFPISNDDKLGDEKTGVQDLQPTRSIVVGQVEDDRNGEFHRSISPRQIHIISLGSNIGSGVFIATGKALATGGPGNMVIAYFLVCSCVWAVLQSLSEMTIAFPVSGNYIDYADRWVDPALAFGAGFAEWLGWAAIVAAEAGFFHVLLRFWAPESFPQAATTLVLGAGPNGYLHRGETWTRLPPFLNGFTGFANCALLATWAVGDQVFVGIMGGEANSPRFSMAHATKLVPFRVNFIYMLSVIFITILVPSDDERLLGGSSVSASPFVIAVESSGIRGISSLLNAGMMCGVLAIAAESVYLSSRVLRSMSHQKLISGRLARVDDKGRPRLALLVTCVVAAVLSYIQLSGDGIKVLNWLVSITSASFFTNWIIISFTNWRFRCAIKAQGDLLFSQTYAWESYAWPLAPAWLMLVSLILLASCLACGINPIGGGGFTAENFFQYTIGLILILGATLGYKIIYRTPWRDPNSADCITGRRELSPEEIKQLDEYYKQPKIRRFFSYVQLCNRTEILLVGLM
ncbi:hypothetical protein CNYM01_06469 [Colletotrichum nymphaeae SA-01]|uniref:Amino acid permease/ SLC12A domain-containing protein n=1 Tax=Colletotrichum nymphaeae SA-01 TaxID=1460502 RepID=A0A135UFJ6_9PEZI|nr:hypothetical protein CNYM01_06469 [Colletotrichum nymphaeae SA-01]